MAFSLALDAPAEKASRVSFENASRASAEIRISGRDLLGEEAWLRAVKAAAPSSDVLQLMASRIFFTSSGRYYVPSESERAEILALKKNPDIAVRVLAAATRAYKAELETLVGRGPSRGALLVAHVYGVAIAERYMKAMAGNCAAPAASVVPALVQLLNEGGARYGICTLDRRLTRVLREGTSEVAENSASAKTAARSADLKGSLTKPESQVRPAVAEAR